MSWATDLQFEANSLSLTIFFQLQCVEKLTRALDEHNFFCNHIVKKQARYYRAGALV